MREGVADVQQEYLKMNFFIKNGRPQKRPQNAHKTKIK